VRDGTIKHGGGSKVLGSPLEAVKFLLHELTRDPEAEPLRAGEIVTTGTLTEAMPVKTGQTWSTEMHGLGLPGLRATFA
jgi:2-keto-4-pentenoate hydratase